MKFLILTALLVASSAVASKRHERKDPPLAHAKHCGVMGEDDACVAAELKHGRAAVVTLTCEDGTDVEVRVWFSRGQIHFSPPSAKAACP